MKEVHNPTKDTIRIIFKGETWEVSPEASKPVPSEVANFWKNVHEFITVTEYTGKVPQALQGKVKEVEVEEEVKIKTSEDKIKKTK